MCSHNRKKKTLKCIESLVKQKITKNISLNIILVDDGCTDGTAEAVGKEVPDIIVLNGDGNLYWCGAMRMAMAYVVDNNYDYCIWLNDDTVLYPHALEALVGISVREFPEQQGIVVGSIRDPMTGKLSYGGSMNNCWWQPLRFERIEPNGATQVCDVFNGNFVLIPTRVVKKVGNIHPAFIHAGGDYEFALRATKKGVPILVAPDYYGECSRNPIKNTWMDPELSLLERYKKIFSVKGWPIRQRYIYYKEYGGIFWWLLFPLVYLRPVLISFKQHFEKA